MIKTFTATLMMTTGALGSCMSSDSIDMEVGPKTTETVQVASFDSLEVAGPYTVTVVADGDRSIEAEGPANVIENTEFVVEDGELTIRPKKKDGQHIDWKGNANVTVRINGVMLKAAGIAGSGDISIDKVAGDSFDGTIAGSGDLKLASLAVKRGEFSIAGSGDVEAAGTADALEVDIAGSGGFAGSGLESKTAEISIAGSGDVSTRATETADISIVGAGDVYIAGGAKCTISKAGSGDVNCE